MAKDPAFLFYPGDYLRDTQCLSESVQVAYDRIMCEHMRNICISHDRLKFFTKKLSVDEIEELKSVMVQTNEGFYIDWVRESIIKRKAYSESRRNNRKPKKINDINNICESYDNHMENENEIDIELINNKIGGVGERPNYTPSLDNQHVEVDQLKPILMQRTSWRDIQQRNGKYTDEQFEITVNAFIEWLKEKGELTKTPKDARFHYNNFAKRKRSEKTVIKAPAYRKLD